MASAQSTIDLIFNGIDNASEVAKKVSGSLGDMAGSAQDITQPLADMAGKLAVVQTAMLALGGVIGGLAFNESAKFQESLASLQKQMDENEGGAQQYVAQLRELALKYGENANALTESAADFKAAGYDIDTSMTLVKGSMDLAIAGGIETAKAVDIMNRSLAGFQVPASDVVRISAQIGDVLNKAADITKSSFSELAQGFADLSPIAKQTGLSIEETAAILTSIIDVFGSGAEAANGLKSGFLALVDPSKESAAQMAKMGVSIRDSSGELKSVKDILAELAPAFERLSESERLAAASTIFGKDQSAKLVQVMLTYGDAMERADILTKQAGGSIEREVGIKLGLATKEVDRTNEAFRQLLETIGNQSLGAFQGVIGSVVDLAIAFRDVVESGKLDPLFDSLKGNLGEVETLFRTIAANLPAAFNGLDFSGLQSSLGQLGEAGKVAFEALFGPVDLSTVEGLRAALQKIVNLVEGLVRVTAGELGGLAPFLKGVGELAKAFVEADANTQGFLGKLLGLGTALNQAAGYFDGINTALLSFIAFGPKLAGVGTALGNVALGIKGFAASSAGLALGVAGVAAGVGVLAFELTRLSGMDKAINDVLAPDWLAGKGATLGTAVGDLAESLGLIGGAAVAASTPIHRLSAEFDIQVAAARATREGINAYLDAQENAAKATRDTADETAALTATFRQQGYEWDAATGKLTRLKDQLDARPIPDNIVTGAYFANVEGAVAINQALVKSYEQIGGGTVKATGAFKAVGESAAESAAKVDEATKKSQEYLLKMEEIASNERIKTIEAVVSLKTEGLKADADRVKSTFESINGVIESTGDLIGSLWGSAKDADRYTQLKIEAQIAEENRRRQEALDLQKKLAEAEIERIQAQTAALDRGDAMIKIEDKGLEPELKAFLWKILKLIRVEGNAEFQQYLLGLNPA